MLYHLHYCSQTSYVRVYVRDQPLLDSIVPGIDTHLYNVSGFVFGSPLRCLPSRLLCGAWTSLAVLGYNRNGGRSLSTRCTSDYPNRGIRLIVASVVVAGACWAADVRPRVCTAVQIQTKEPLAHPSLPYRRRLGERTCLCLSTCKRESVCWSLCDHVCLICVLALQASWIGGLAPAAPAGVCWELCTPRLATTTATTAGGTTATDPCTSFR